MSRLVDFGRCMGRRRAIGEFVDIFIHLSDSENLWAKKVLHPVESENESVSKLGLMLRRYSFQGSFGYCFFFVPFSFLFESVGAFFLSPFSSPKLLLTSRY